MKRVLIHCIYAQSPYLICLAHFLFNPRRLVKGTGHFGETKALFLYLLFRNQPRGGFLYWEESHYPTWWFMILLVASVYFASSQFMLVLKKYKYSRRKHWKHRGRKTLGYGKGEKNLGKQKLMWIRGLREVLEIGSPEGKEIRGEGNGGTSCAKPCWTRPESSPDWPLISSKYCPAPLQFVRCDGTAGQSGVARGHGP